MTVIGPLCGPITIENAVIATLREWLGAYLLEVETQLGLPAKTVGRPPTPESYRGALDWLSVKDDWLPEVNVICNPEGEPERMDETIMQGFAVQIGCKVKSEEGTDPEGIARRNASLSATAAMGAIQQHETLGLGPTVLEELHLTGSPKVEFMDAEDRRYAVGVTTFLVHAQMIQWKEGPQVVKEVEPEGPYPEAPEVKTDTTTVKAVPPTESV